jgi:hypothetical protein
MNHILGIYVYS